jgi:hypothetical protein
MTPCTGSNTISCHVAAVNQCSRHDSWMWINFGAPELDFDGLLGDGGAELEWGTCQEREEHQ